MTTIRGKFSIEVPFPTDLAPFKVVYTNTTTGERKIVNSAQTRDKARELLQRHLVGDIIKPPFR